MPSSIKKKSQNLPILPYFLFGVHYFFPHPCTVRGVRKTFKKIEYQQRISWSLKLPIIYSMCHHGILGHSGLHLGHEHCCGRVNCRYKIGTREEKLQELTSDVEQRPLAFF